MHGAVFAFGRRNMRWIDGYDAQIGIGHESMIRRTGGT
jgi:hypothetical protein